MAHIKAKRIGLDVLSNVRTLCSRCHRKEHEWGPTGIKPVPKKEH
jgi:5-methylcytosine-specific restriction endonuclease McrA